MSGILDTQLVLIEDVAAELGVSPFTAREWCRKGQMPCIKHGGKRRVWLRRDWLDLWLSGAELETIHTANGGRIVRPKGGRR